ncbi:Zinc finger CONSTANS-LIKE 2-like protein [Gossypium australe]|uniref:Zinc finger CONSTANS-LIKE 2-like protein n=1 Tax=Gossypium australe TaxID=47621 RepID=A0A5B6U7E7_9ROSI|nr:Zinc finger CONSTANS-LIKE 2-like protein [Gossypium australe]
MGDNTQLRSDEEQPPPAQIPLLSSNLQNDAVGGLHQRQQEIRTSNRLDDSLEYLERFLTCLGFNQSSLLSFSLSWAAFTVVGVLVPVLALELSECDGCEMYQIKNFEVGIVASQACLAAVSLFCISFNLRKYGIRRFLFVDRYGGQMVRFTDLYVKQIAASMRLLIWWLLPCFILKTAREFLVVTVSQVVTLFQTTVYSGMINLSNGDLRDCSGSWDHSLLACSHQNFS